ncbi:hypothetical protein ACQPZX_23085 [Actinoplanes sp. CA-142083]|uniref:hypothetical protein n=1 Tax=Actinoplanes sp. CA-142083 TaxID=3239903 RepID=UPI003D93E292
MRIDEGRQEAGHTPRLRPVWLVAVASVLVATAALATVYIWLDHSLIPSTAPGGSESDRTLNVFKTTVALATFVGAVLAGVYAYRKQRLTEGDARRADAEQLIGRFGKASEQLGHASPAVRLAGVYAMSSLADDWAPQRQMCINVLTVYLQVPFEADPARPEYAHGEKVVRRTIVRVIRDHLRPGFSSVSWQGYNFRFEEAIFYGGDLTGARFTGGNVSFYGARFVEGKFHFNNVVFGGARVSFHRAVVEGGVVTFAGASMTAGELDFTDSALTGGEVVGTGFDHRGGELTDGPMAPQLGRDRA